MSNSLNRNENEVVSVPITEAEIVDPGVTAEAIERFYESDAARNRNDSKENMKAFDEYVNENFIKKGNGLLAIELKNDVKIYYLWDKDFRSVHSLMNNSIYADTTIPSSEATLELGGVSTRMGAPYNENAFPVQVEKKNLWDKICGLFGHKTDHVKKIERTEQINALRSKALAYALVKEKNNVDADFLKPTEEEQAKLSLGDQELEAYLKTGALPPKQTSEKGLGQEVPKGGNKQVDPVERLIGRIRDKNIEIEPAILDYLKDDLNILRRRGDLSTTVKNMGIYLCGLKDEALKGFVEMYKDEVDNGQHKLLDNWSQNVINVEEGRQANKNVSVKELTNELTNKINRYTKQQPMNAPVGPG